jgi:NitT/TauT family transport system substrate-binding protein
MIRSKKWVALLVVVALGAIGCTQAPGASVSLTKVRVQLQWVPQAQFAGEIAAKAEGYYAAEGLDVELVAGGPNVANITVGCAANGP